MFNYLTNKKENILTAFILLLSLNTYSQCTEQVASFGNNTSIAIYNVTGDVSLSLNTNNTITLDLASNFSTASGPDVRAYLVNSNGVSDGVLKETNITDLENIQFGLVSCSGCSPRIRPEGEKSFTIDIPSDVNIQDYDKVFFYCLEFERFWDFGSFTPFTSNSCAVLSTEENTFQNINIYPNPASTTLQLSNIDIANTEISIFDLSGKRVFLQKKGNSQNIIDISNLRSGIYVLSVVEDNKQLSQRLVIQ